MPGAMGGYRSVYTMLMPQKLKMEQGEELEAETWTQNGYGASLLEPN